LTPAARKRLEKLPRADFLRLDAKIHALAEDPHPPGSTKLEGADDLYRIRYGDYRVIYTVENDRLVVAVVKVANRRDAYRP
jgi:mRNA interferase RelE/StbE